MGDASLPPILARLHKDEAAKPQFIPIDGVREVNVLATGFGAFKAFTTNPSYLVASHLSRQLNPESKTVSAAVKQTRPTDQVPIRDPDTRPYRVNVHVYPDPVKVAYDAVAELIPQIVHDPFIQTAPPGFVKPASGFDYVLHIGMAAGRENYTLETVAHRNNYKLKDVDEQDGSQVEKRWNELGLPEVLDVGWNKEDVLTRWEALTRQREDEYEYEEMIKAGWKEKGGMTLVETARLRSRVFLGKGKRAVVKLSRDAGRYLCEFIFYTALSTRWKESQQAERAALDESFSVPAGHPQEKIGKIAFLHVPGGTEKHDVARGARVAESAILAIVGSWEDGYRNPDVYGGNSEKSDGVGTEPRTMYETKGTGDR